MDEIPFDHLFATRFRRQIVPQPHLPSAFDAHWPRDVREEFLLPSKRPKIPPAATVGPYDLWWYPLVVVVVYNLALAIDTQYRPATIPA